jgi:outer membrane protein assembly factor BamB
MIVCLRCQSSLIRSAVCPRCDRRIDRRIGGGSAVFSILILSILAGIPTYFLGRNIWNYLHDPETALLALDTDRGKVRWVQGFGQKIARSIAASNDRVFVGTAIDSSLQQDKKYQIEAFAAPTGQKLWSIAPPRTETQDVEQLARFVPLRAAGDRLWLSTIDDIRPPNSNKQSDRTVKNVRRGRVLHIDARTGSITHSIERNWQIEHLSLDGIAIAGSSTGILRVDSALATHLEAYSHETGKQRWQVDLAPASSQTTTFVYGRYRLFADGESFYVFDLLDWRLSAYDGQTGKSKFQLAMSEGLGSKDLQVFDSSVPIDGYLAIEDRRIYALQQNGSKPTISAFDADTGTRQWQYPIPIDRAFHSAKGKGSYTRCVRPTSISVARSVVHLFCESKTIHQSMADGIVIDTLDTQTGQPIWNFHWDDDDVWRSPSNPRRYVSDSTYTYGVSIEHDRSGRGNFQDSIIAIAHDRQAKRQVWTWQPKFKLDENTLTIDGDRLFILANVPRWRIISGAID